LVLVSVCNISAEEKRKDIQIFASLQLHCLNLGEGGKLTSLYLFIYLPTLSRRSETEVPCPDVKYYSGISEAPEEYKEVPRSE
jgi:hypothetical protein